ITDEINAMNTMGFRSFEFIIIPRVMALVIAMPLIVALSDAIRDRKSTLFKGFEKNKFKKNLKDWIHTLKTYNKNALIMLVSPPTVVKK
ncbi:ABC transporter permease, partial [Campylobacter coli]